MRRTVRMRWRELQDMRQPQWLRYGNLGLAFLLELAALIGFAAIGVLFAGWMQLVAGVIGAALFVLLWGFFAAPRSKRRLTGMNLLLFKIGMFTVAAVILVAIGQPGWGVALAVLAAVNLTLAALLRQH